VTCHQEQPLLEWSPAPEQEEAVKARPRPSLEPLADWLGAIGAGDTEAFHRLYLATAPKLLRVAKRIVGREGIAEEVLQDSFVSVWQNAASYRRDRSAPMTWLASIVRNRAIDSFRGGERASVPIEDAVESIVDLGVGPEESLLRKQVVRVFESHLVSLKPAQRQALYLTYYRGMTNREIAVFLGFPLGTIKSWIRRGLADYTDLEPIR